MSEAKGRWMWAAVNRFGYISSVRNTRRETIESILEVMGETSWKAARRRYAMRAIKVQVIPEGQDQIEGGRQHG